MFKTFMGGNKGGGQQGGSGAGAAPPLAPRFAKHTPMDAHFFISEEPSWRAAATGSDPIWVASDVELAGSKEQRYSYVYRPSQAVQHNGSVWVHAVFTPPGASPSPKDDFFDKGATFARSRELVAYLPKPKVGEVRYKCEVFMKRYAMGVAAVMPRILRAMGEAGPVFET